MKTIRLLNESASSCALSLRVCDTFWFKFRGLMFSSGLKPYEGIVIVEKNATRMNTAIHMLFMNFDVAVIWLNKDKTVVDKVLAKKWRPLYIPKRSAKYVLELHSSRLQDFSLGDQCKFLES